MKAWRKFNIEDIEVGKVYDVWTYDSHIFTRCNYALCATYQDCFLMFRESEEIK